MSYPVLDLLEIAKEVAEICGGGKGNGNRYKNSR